MNVDIETRCKLARYLALIRKRASGELWTAARWIREFVMRHPDYKHDSIVNDRICYDLIKATVKITEDNGNGAKEGREMFVANQKPLNGEAQ